MLPGIERLRDLPADPRTSGVGRPVLMLTARDSVEDRVAGLDIGRRRLPRQAVRVRRAARAPARAGAAGRAGAARACSRWMICDSTRRPAGCGGGPPRSSSRPRSSRCSRRSCAGPTRCSRACICSSTPGTSPTRTARTSIDVYIRPPAQQDRRAVRPAVARDRPRSRLPAARGQRRLSRLPIRLRVAAAFAVAMAAVLVALGLDPLRPPRLAPRRSRSTGSCGCAPTTSRCSSRQPGTPLATRAPQPLRRVGRELRAAARPARARARRDARRSAAHPCSVPTSCGGRWRGDDLRRTAARCRASTSRRACFATPTSRGAGNASCSSSAITREDRAETLRSLRDELLIAGPIALAARDARGLRPRRARAPTGRDDAAPGGGDLGRDAGRAAARAADRRRGRAARRDAQRDARPARGCARSASATSSRTPATSCGRRSRSCARSSSSRSGTARTTAELRAGAAAIVARRSIGSRSSPRTLLLIARSDRGQLPLRLETLEPAELLDLDRHAASSGGPGRPGRSISVAAAPGLNLRGDRMRLEQALGNLVETRSATAPAT